MDRRLFSFLKPLRWIKGRNFEAHTNNVAITTNDMSRKNLVSYAEGTLDYRPAAHSGGTVAFTSADDKVTQYFSDRRHAAGGFVTQLFDASQTDPLTVSIEQLGTIQIGHSPYLISLRSSKWHSNDHFEPQVEAVTNIIYGVIKTSFVTISLCNRTATEIR
jgi:hypothetical protein